MVSKKLSVHVLVVLYIVNEYMYRILFKSIYNVVNFDSYTNRIEVEIKNTTFPVELDSKVSVYKIILNVLYY